MNGNVKQFVVVCVPILNVENFYAVTTKILLKKIGYIISINQNMKVNEKDSGHKGCEMNGILLWLQSCIIKRAA